ncbi:prepilin-type N-terminal cleavage/methylation domain-containing protein [Ectothiorhodospiraceae bacterium BW-2]|nr:prepilin-type N-terminal cleavage/methylation domain-containing protein [Ectothiorhodospiraceae bacterium BW-2]
MHRLKSGFTLVELVMTIVIIGIVAGILAPIITQTINAYSDTEIRMELTARGRLALERLAREVRQVVPNTVRELNSGQGVEFVTSKIGGRYMSQKDGFSNSKYQANRRFRKNANMTNLYVLGAEYTNFINTDMLVIYNDSESVLNDRSSRITNVVAKDRDNDDNDNNEDTGNKEVQLLTFSSQKWSVEPASQHFQIADYCHDIGVTSNALYWHRTFAGDTSTNQFNTNCSDGNANWSDTDLILVSSESLNATFEYLPTSLTSNAILKVTLTLTEGDESVTMVQEMHVRNTP